MGQPLNRVVILGGGLSGCLAALALARRRPEVDFVLIERDGTLGGNHTWSFFDTDVAEPDRWLLDGIAVSHWPDHEIHFPRRQRVIGIGYNSITSESLDAAVRKVVRPDQLMLGREVREFTPELVVLNGGEREEATTVIDARGPGPTDGLDLGWQKFLGRRYRFDRPHGRTRPMIMDATVDQADGYRFIYMLPFTDREMLVEDTYYSTSPVLDLETVADRVEAAAGPFGNREIVLEEHGSLPVLIGGSVDALWKGEAVPRLGLKGGFFHPTTGYSLPDAIRNAALLARQTDMTSACLHELFHRRARKLWRERYYFQLLNRMLFIGAAPPERYRVLEHFYRLPEAIIARFYACSLNAADKLRILTGRPPVPIGRAIRSMMRRSA